jgi:glycosyltransferase involved in cell wall biosynthesis
LYQKVSLDDPTGCSLEKDRRWVVVHDAARDNYELPIALAEAGALERFVTDWYTPLDKSLWRWLAKTKVAKSVFRMSKRFRAELPSRLTADKKLVFLAGAVRFRLGHRCFLDEVTGGKTGRYAALIANQNGTHLLAASYNAAAAFEQLRPGLKRVLFQVHPQPRFLRSLYTSQMERDPDYAGLIHELEVAVSEEVLASWEQESKLADHILCASSFTRRSLEVSGIAPNRISVIPYGVDSEMFQLGRPTADGPLKVLYVGQKVARKGLRMLLRVWQQLQPTNARLVLAGGHARDQSLLQGFDNLFTEVPKMGNRNLTRLYQEADLFVVPSLAEGFGHVYLEALSCGVPIICTENTGAADIIRDGESGWIIPAGDSVALADCLRWALSHRAQLREMRDAARAVAEMHPWQRFRKSIRQTLLSTATQSHLPTTSASQASYEAPATVKEYV